MTQNRPAWQRWLPLILVAIVAITGALLLRDQLTFAALRDNREALLALRDVRPVASVALFMAVYVAIVGFSLPGATLATLTGGFLFGVFPGALYNVTAATLGAVAIFTVVRLGLGEGLRARVDAGNGTIRRISDGIRRNEVPVLLSMRLMPALPFFITNFIPAFLGVATWRFAWTTYVGILPGGVIYTWVGSGLGEVFARGETPNMGVIFEPQFLLPILALVALSLAPIVVKTLRRA
jgi:uncharacterized membrane protein YdjX (TVP38/TMEM64 family)